MDALKLLFSDEYREQMGVIIMERVLPSALGLLLIVVGIVFVLAGTKTAQTLSGIAEIVATKGGSLAKGITK